MTNHIDHTSRTVSACFSASFHVQHFSGYFFTNLLLYMCSIISIPAFSTQKPWVPSNPTSPNGRTTSPPCSPQHSSLPRLPDADPGREGEIYEWKIQHHPRWNLNFEPIFVAKSDKWLKKPIFCVFFTHVHSCITMSSLIFYVKKSQTAWRKLLKLSDATIRPLNDTWSDDAAPFFGCWEAPSTMKQRYLGSLVEKLPIYERDRREKNSTARE